MRAIREFLAPAGRAIAAIALGAVVVLGALAALGAATAAPAGATHAVAFLKPPWKPGDVSMWSPLH